MKCFKQYRIFSFIPRIIIALNKQNGFLLVMFLVWFLFSLRLFSAQLNSMETLIQRYLYSEEEILEMHDGGFYSFMNACHESIPKDADVIFEVKSKGLGVYSKTWFNKGYYRQKSPYYLYPRKVFRSGWVRNRNGNTYILDINHDKWRKHKRINYKIVHNVQKDQFDLYFNDILKISHGAN